MREKRREGWNETRFLFDFLREETQVCLLRGLLVPI